MSAQMNMIPDLEKERSALLAFMEKTIDVQVLKALQEVSSLDSGGTQCKELELVESDGTLYAYKG